MCGPIALALPVNRRDSTSKFIGVSIYNLGRILVYGAFGVIFGLFGKGLNVSGYQQIMSLVLGCLVILFLVFPRIFKGIKLAKVVTGKVIQPFKKQFANRFSKSGNSSLFVFGVLNGLLPCGMVYMAAAGALVTGTWYGGALFMMLFGLGTLPAMLGLPYIGSVLTAGQHKWIKKIVPALTLIFGLLLILRGANLDIPYISPSFKTEAGTTHIKCH
jgi:sulfite exporter TauE/SafE